MKPRSPNKPRNPRRDPRPIRILAVDPGTRYMGVAFLVGQELLRADVKTVREGKMTAEEILEKTERILQQWIRRYQPDVLAVEKTYFAQSKRSQLLNAMGDRIKTVGKQERVRVREYAPTTVRRFLCRNGRPTRMGAARVIATAHFPWLYPFYEKEAAKVWWRQKYWTRLFDAIAVGLTCYGKAVGRQADRDAA